MRTKTTTFAVAVLVSFAALVTFPTHVLAQEKSADKIARELSNPNTGLASLTLKNQFRWFEGDLPNADDQSSYTLLFQPALPFPLESGGKIIWRPAVPLIVDQPVFELGKLDFDGETGLGDIGFDLVYARTSESGLLLAAGLFSTLPTATSSDLGSGQWSRGLNRETGQEVCSWDSSQPSVGRVRLE